MLHSQPEDRSSAEVVVSKLRGSEANRFCATCKAVMLSKDEEMPDAPEYPSFADLPPSRSQAPINVNSTDSIVRVYNDPLRDSLRIRNSSGDPTRRSFPQPNLDHATYQEGPELGTESAAPGVVSRYHTPPHHHHHHQGISYKPERADPEFASDMTFEASITSVNSTPSEPAEALRIQPDQTFQYISRGVTQRQFECINCEEIFKCKSDYKCVSSYQTSDNPDTFNVESTCSSIINPSNAIFQTVAEMSEGLPLPMILQGVRKAYISSGS